jgi:hypothetical protein
VGRAWKGEKREGEEEGLGWAGKRGEGEKERDGDGLWLFFLFFIKGCYKTYPLKDNLILEIRKHWKTTEGIPQSAHLLFLT